jgi:hypothetical protein
MMKCGFKIEERPISLCGGKTFMVGYPFILNPSKGEGYTSRPPAAPIIPPRVRATHHALPPHPSSLQE